MTLYKNVNGLQVELTPQEIDEYNQRQAEWEDGESDRIIAKFTLFLEKAINEKAAEKLYSSGISCASYISSTNAQWASEATAFIAWRDACYTYAYDYLARAQGGEIPNPSVDDFMATVPAMVWPEPPSEE